MTAWATPAAILIAAEYGFALLIGMRVGFHYSIPLVAYLVIGLTITGIAAAATIVVRLVVYARQGEQHPTKRLIREAPRFYGFAAGTILVALQISVLTWTKVMLPIASPFWADPLLANLDHAIFGSDPWILAQRLFGWAEPAIDSTYVTWAPVKFATFVLVLVMPETRTKARIFVTYFMMMAAVAVGQYILSSAGPVFFQQFGFGPRFSQLALQPWVVAAKSYLWQDYLKAGGDIGGGISAMPSLHVAGALWVALAGYSYDRRIGVVGFAYFAIILIGSVLLGWHYAVDGIAGALITALAWLAAPKVADWSCLAIFGANPEPAAGKSRSPASTATGTATTPPHRSASS
jgi:hypothetical protein